MLPRYIWPARISHLAEPEFSDRLLDAALHWELRAEILTQLAATEFPESMRARRPAGLMRLGQLHLDKLEAALESYDQALLRTGADEYGCRLSKGALLHRIVRGLSAYMNSTEGSLSESIPSNALQHWSQLLHQKQFFMVKRACESLDRAEQLTPESTSVPRIRAELLGEFCKYWECWTDRAERDYQRCMDLGPQDAEFWMAWAQFREANHGQDNARQIIDRAVAQNKELDDQFRATFDWYEG